MSFTIIPPRQDLTDQNAAIDVNDLYKNTEYFYDAIRVDSGSVGIGTSTPDTVLQIQTTAECGLSLVADSANNSLIYFGESGSELTKGKIYYSNANDNMRFYTLNIEAVRIDSSQLVNIVEKISVGSPSSVAVVAGGIHLEMDGTVGDAIVIKDGTTGYFSVNSIGHLGLGGPTDLFISMSITNSKTGGTGVYGLMDGGGEIDGTYLLMQGTGTYNRGIYADCSGAATTNYALYGKATGAGTNWGLYIEAGNSYMADSLNVVGGLDAGNNGAYLKTKVLPISDWDMDADITYPSGVTHGLNADKIIHVFCIMSDGSNYYPLDRTDGSGGVSGGVSQITSTVINLNRDAAGFFDAPAFNSATGQVYVVYEA